MGTLQEQPVRNRRTVEYDSVSDLIDALTTLSSPDITLSQAIKVWEIMEYKRRTDIMIDNGDIHDEQMAGIGEILTERNNLFAQAYVLHPDAPSALEKIAMIFQDKQFFRDGE